MGYQKIYVSYGNVHFFLIKSEPKKSFGHKTVLPIEKKFAKSQKNRFFGYPFFLGALFTEVKCTFLNQFKKDGFFIHHSKKKVFIS
jgi:hypothetical protein